MTTNLQPGRLFTWVDVDAHLTRLATRGAWPDWLLEADSYWDSLHLATSSRVTREVVGEWLEDAFGPGSTSRTDQALSLVLDGLPGAEAARFLPVSFEVEELDVSRRELRWIDRRINRGLGGAIGAPVDALPGGVSVIAFHSFKGGVGRTLHAVALAEALATAGGRVLLVDADLEAPGISWMYEASGKRVDFSYADFLALAHGSADPEARDAVELGAAYLKNQTLGRITVLPAGRGLDAISLPRIQPQDLAIPSRSPYYLTEAIARLAKAVGADVAVVDLRAGHSELAAPVLLDPRVQRFFVTTVSAQSIDGLALTIREIIRRAPTRESDPPSALVLTQYRQAESESVLGGLAAPLIDAMSEALPDTAVTETSAVDSALLLEPILSVFQESLLGLPAGWDDVVARVHSQGLVDLFEATARDTLHTSGSSPVSTAPELGDMRERRSKLASFASSLVYAETTDSQSFLATGSLQKLVESHRTELPLCVVTGAKGAGKTFTQLQMSYRKTWADYAADVGVDDVDMDAPLVPVLTSQNVSTDIARKVESVRRSAAAGMPDEPIPMLEIRSALQDGISSELSERDWRQLWIWCMARSAGVDVQRSEAEAALVEFGSQNRRVFLIDGLEDILQDVSTNAVQQRALRVLLVDCLEWLRSIRGGRFGLIVFVRIDLVRAAVKQNSGQFLARYKDYALRWDPSEAVRLALWVTQHSGARSELDPSAVNAASDAALTEYMLPVWGDKMGGPKSREARSRGWFIAALSDFNGGIQARDIVTFLAESAKGSVEDARWVDRLLTPLAMREALVQCSVQKIGAIGEETPAIGILLTQLRNLPVESRQVPFTQDAVDLSVADLDLLTENGVVFREGDRYWIPEIFRHGLGFRASGRPRIVAVANLVRRRNNQE